MPVRCVYKDCNNSSLSTSVFRFPAQDADRLNLWIKNSGNENLLSLTNDELKRRFICEVHFNRINISKGDRRKRLLGPAVPIEYQSTKTQVATAPTSSTSVSQDLVDTSNITHTELLTERVAVNGKILPSKTLWTTDHETLTFDATKVTRGYSRHGCRNIGVHLFPKDEKIREQWEKAVRRRNFKATKHSRLCSEHFKAEDYISEGFTSGLKLSRRILKKGVIPSHFVFYKKDIIRDELRSKKAEKREQKRQLFLKTDVPEVNTPRVESQFSWQKATENLEDKAAARADANCGGEAQLVPDILEPAKDSKIVFSCNVCKDSITGFRYTCVQCAGWELCAACETRGEHSAHFVLRVPLGKTLSETQEVLAAIRSILPSQTTDTALVKQEIKTEDPSRVDGLDVLGDNVGHTLETQEEYLDTDSTDTAESYILPTAQPKRKISTKKKEIEREVVARKKLKHINIIDGTKTKCASTLPKKLKHTDRTGNKTSSKPTVVQKDNSHTVPTAVSQTNSPNVRTVKLKKVKLVKGTPIKSLTPIVPIATPMPMCKTAPNTIQLVPLEKLKSVSAVTQQTGLTSTVVQKGSSRRNTGEEASSEEVSIKMECFPESEDISDTVAPFITIEIECQKEASFGQKSESFAATSDKVIVKLEQVDNETSRDLLKNGETQLSKGPS